MGSKVENNFRKRLGDRINIVYLEKPLASTEQRIQNERISSALFEVLTGILQREPTQEEVFGFVDISKMRRRRIKT